MKSMRNSCWATLATVMLALPAISAHAEESRPRTVNVSGQAEVSAAPDMARLTLGVESRKPTLPAARTEVAAAVDRLLALTRDLKIDPKHVNATGIQVQPEYSWNDKDRKRVLLGYVVSRQVEVELHDLEQLGPLLERAITAGANQVGDPQLDSSRRKDLEREAMTKAVDDARRNAETLARAANAKLGPVRSLNGTSTPPMVPMYKMRVAMADAAAPSPEQTYQAGDMKFSATVNAEYDLVTSP